MASLPSQPSAPQRQTSHQRTPSPNAINARRMNRSSHSFTSEDSQTLLIDTPTSPSTSQNDSPKPSSPISTGHATAGSSTAPPAPEPRKCWICFSDETEDTPADSEWVSPCPCALTAHQACLLDWVADLRAPNRKDAKEKVQCPQCKADIKVAQPRSVAVEITHGFERVWARTFIPVGGAFVGIALGGACYIHGFASIFFMMGKTDAVRLLGIRRVDGQVNTNVFFGLPFIPIVLALSRTSYADGIFPILPMFFLMNRQRPTKNGPLWPPSMMMTLCAMPYIRSIYNGFHKKVIAPREEAWLKAIQPRAAQDSDAAPDDAAAAQPEPQNAAEDNLLDFELGVQVEVIEEEEEVVEPPPNNGPGQPPQPENQAQPPQPQIDLLQPQNDLNLARPANPPAHFQRHINIDLSAIASAIIGGLLFPTIATGMGFALHTLLPSRLTTPPRSHWLHGPARQTGLLQSRWGRSLVGGLLFVVLKDALVFWTSWSRKEGHRRRRVLNLGEAGGEVGGALP